VKRARSLRSRLTLLFIGVAGGTVLAAAIGMALLVEHAVWAPLDAELGEEAETVCSLLAAGALDDVRQAAAAMAAEHAPGPGKFMRVSRPDGSVLARAGRLPQAIRDYSPGPGSGGHTIDIPRVGPYRAYWYNDSSMCRALVGAGAARYARTLRRAWIAIVSVAGGLLAALLALAWIITGRATSELGRLAEEIETIEAGSLARRLVPRQTLEIDRLAAVLNRLLERLEAAMTHLKDFTADAAHELRTPVASLRARLEVTLSGERSERAYHDGLLDALEQTERIGSLAEHLLALSAVEAGVDAEDAGPVRLDALAREVCESLEPVAQEQERRFECVAKAPIMVRGEPQLLKRLLLNLIDNAFRHTPRATGVRLTVGTAGDDAIVQVSDEGPGIPHDELPRVFDRFRRGKAAPAGGRGLGLALCREIVARHRGSIVVENREGTTVTVRLPL
jgi:signal transduction histidine kinase